MWGEKNPKLLGKRENKTNNLDSLFLDQENLRILTAESSLSITFPTISLKPETLKRNVSPTRLSQVTSS